MEIHTATVSNEHCIVLPSAVRKMLNVKKGEQLALLVEHGKIYLEKVGATGGNPSDPNPNEDVDDGFWEGNVDQHEKDGALTQFRNT